jgi:branched-chain amino acid aminotransferase
MGMKCSTTSRAISFTLRRSLCVGTAAECIGLSEIDFRTIGNGKTGPITKKIQDVYHDAIRGKVKKYEEWCDYVG